MLLWNVYLWIIVNIGRPARRLIGWLIYKDISKIEKENVNSKFGGESGAIGAVNFLISCTERAFRFIITVTLG